MQQGIVNQNMANPAGGGAITPESVKQNMSIPPNLQNAFDRVATAGMKLMFGKETNKHMLKGFDQGKAAEQIGNGMVVLVSILIEKSNNTIPPEIIIPVGIYLITQAADFYEKSELAKVTNEDIGNAIQIYIFQIIRKLGGDPDQMMQRLGQFTPEQAQQAAAAQAGQQPQSQGV